MLGGRVLVFSSPPTFMSFPMKMRRCLSVLMLLGAVACWGCGGAPPKGGERLDVFPVSGEAFADGKPAKDAMVLLHPETPHQLPEGARPISSSGQVDENGKFVISTYGNADGAPAGKYKVTISWPAAVGMSGRLDGEDRLGGRYSDPKSSQIEFEVAGSPVTIPRIDLSTQ